MEKSCRVITCLSPGKHDRYKEFVDKKISEGVSEAELVRMGLRSLAEKENFDLSLSFQKEGKYDKNIHKRSLRRPEEGPVLC